MANKITDKKFKLYAKRLAEYVYDDRERADYLERCRENGHKPENFEANDFHIFAIACLVLRVRPIFSNEELDRAGYLILG